MCVTGAPLAEIKKRAGERLAAGDPWDEPEYEKYPPALKSPYRERRSAFGEQRYGALGIPREDLEARQRAAAANWECFGAPAALFCYIDRDMGPAQWSDVGMYLQTVMLLLRAEGLHSCPQMAWAKYHRTVAEVLSPPDELILFCGMSIGFEDVTASRHPYGPGAAGGDGHVRRGIDSRLRTLVLIGRQACCDACQAVCTGRGRPAAAGPLRGASAILSGQGRQDRVAERFGRLA